MRANLLTPKTQKIAYAETLYLLRTFMWDMSKNLGYPFDDDKYNRLVLLFEPTFETYIDDLVRKKSTLFAGDKHGIVSLSALPPDARAALAAPDGQKNEKGEVQD